MSIRSDLETTRTNIAAELAKIDVSLMTYGAGGQGESHDEHRDKLLAQLKAINELLASMGGDNLDQPFEVVGLGAT